MTFFVNLLIEWLIIDIICVKFAIKLFADGCSIKTMFHTHKKQHINHYMRVSHAIRMKVEHFGRQFQDIRSIELTLDPPN